MRGLAWDDMSPAERRRDMARSDAEDDARDQAVEDETCDTCGGSGGGPDAALRCPQCEGRGR